MTKKNTRFDLTTTAGILAYVEHIKANPRKRTDRTGEADKQGCPESMLKLCQDRGVSASGWA